jgi:hypothetical protein
MGSEFIMPGFDSAAPAIRIVEEPAGYEVPSVQHAEIELSRETLEWL